MNEEKDTKDIEKRTRDIVFFGSSSVMYLYKKSIKVSKAVYMITDLIKDKEPVKWSLRVEANKVMTFNSDGRDIKDSMSYLHKYIVNIKGLVSLATFSGNISQMNSDLVSSELDHILNVISEIKYNENEFALSSNFFLEDRRIDSGLFVEKMLKDSLQNKSKAANSGTSYVAKNFTKGQNLKDNVRPVTFINPESRNRRSDEVLSIIRDKGSVTIKDIAGVISGCSEKTIQRELVSLLDKKVIKREGERRWSKYSLV